MARIYSRNSPPRRSRRPTNAFRKRSASKRGVRTGIPQRGVIGSVQHR